MPHNRGSQWSQGSIDPSAMEEDGENYDDDCEVCCEKRVIVGICAMAKKSQSKPMREILTRLSEFEYIETLVFPEEVILNQPVEEWPLCDCLISFHSKGFPLSKAIKYAELRKPFTINDLYFQYDIQDRRRVYKILEDARIELPRYAVLNREHQDEMLESEDHVEVGGVVFNKPFVEKPVSAEDHNIYIYYPTSAGGGSQRLFRKIGSRSSVYSPESRVRKSGSFIYEEFMPTDGTDVKVYTVGPDYAHAEARKSPALDGKVERDKEGKEVRYPVILTNDEKLIARKVCLAFKQTVCGFDLLRANGKSYVCDVNGFSFVKNSMKYYDDCSKILGNMILRELAPQLHIPWSMPFQLDDPPIVPTTFGKMMELRCVIGVIRHGDRTPKQKMKMEVKNHKFFQLFEKHGGYKDGHIKLKKPKQLQEILDIARELLAHKDNDSEVEENRSKLEQLKSVLEMYGHFSGINRKVQLKYQPKGRPRNSSSDDSETPRQPSLVLILKWGGELTPAGRVQAEELGRVFRCMYPGGGGDYSGSQGLGLLRLHSTFRHDLKIYASDEGRVSMTAAAFAKGLLALEGELTPILVQMVKSANTNGLLDNDCDAGKFQNMVKQRLHDTMQVDREFTEEDVERLNPTNAASIEQAMRFIKNPLRACEHVFELIQELTNVIKKKKDDDKGTLYHGESWDLMQRRWAKLEKDFKIKPDKFDISKIPDVYDCIKYDLQHNQHTLQFQHAEELYMYAKALADIVIPQEYGISRQEKLAIGLGVCAPLLKKIRADLHRNTDLGGEGGEGSEGNPTQAESENRLNPQYSHGVSSPGRHVRTRLYFTSESHIHSLLTVLRYGGLVDSGRDEQWRRALSYVSEVSELNYMTQIVIMLYEDETKDVLSEERFHVELHFSPGAMCCVQKNPPPGPGFRPQSQSERSSSPINGDSSPSPEGSQINLAASGSSGVNGSSGQSDIPGKHDSNATLTAATPQSRSSQDLQKTDLSQVALPISPGSTPKRLPFTMPRAARAGAISTASAASICTSTTSAIVCTSCQNNSPPSAACTSPSSAAFPPTSRPPSGIQVLHSPLANAVGSSPTSRPLLTNIVPPVDSSVHYSGLSACSADGTATTLIITKTATTIAVNPTTHMANGRRMRRCRRISCGTSRDPLYTIRPSPSSAPIALSATSLPTTIPSSFLNVTSRRKTIRNATSTSLYSHATLGRYCCRCLSPPSPESQLTETEDDDEMPGGYNPYHTVSGYPMGVSPFGPLVLSGLESESTGSNGPPQQHYSSPSAFLSAFRRTNTINNANIGNNGNASNSAGTRPRPLFNVKPVYSAAGKLFSTAVISGSSSAPDLRAALLPGTAEGPLRVPSIRPLETLHNALSLYQLDVFLSKVTSSTYRTILMSSQAAVSSSGGSGSGVKGSGTAVGVGGSSGNSTLPPVSPSTSWPAWPLGSGPPSFVSSSGPSTPTSSMLDIWMRLKQITDSTQPTPSSTGGASSVVTGPDSLPSSRNSYSTPPSPHENRHKGTTTPAAHSTSSVPSGPFGSGPVISDTHSETEEFPAESGP
ncbi:inositol hexakisphosphate and diphosphoinositol-pentakisphosphate kinase 2-like isoform X2 [Varroa destructor]|uniref:Inositol hexakisphosphate and diphosphoinositol-pentakisphosphate kinase n=1 Tax=Varroa destructor TaxID=109461 RepID=A0A7M7K6P9_VARDE|nr:inositol hexakisphosphate and diphosphoinositol-pentakisphosphate kinase 2-like isoform X2 [Varroa destructor]